MLICLYLARPPQPVPDAPVLPLTDTDTRITLAVRVKNEQIINNMKPAIHAQNNTRQPSKFQASIPKSCVLWLNCIPK